MVDDKKAVVSEDLIKVLACPVDKAELKLEGDALVCVKCKAKYPIKDGIPVLLPPEEVKKVVPPPVKKEPNVIDEELKKKEEI